MNEHTPWWGKLLLLALVLDLVFMGWACYHFPQAVMRMGGGQ